MDTLNDVWKVSELAQAHVMVSRYGQVKTLDRVVVSTRLGKTNTQLRRGTIISPWSDKRGYWIVSITANKTRTKYLVHRLVAHAFCPGFQDGLTVNHINGIKKDNRADNLEWVSLADNTKHQWSIGLVNLRGEKHPSSKLTTEQAQNIWKAKRNGSSATKLAREYGVSVSLVYKIAERTRWASVN